MKSPNVHKPIMLNEIVNFIDFNNCNYFLDGTYGGGGHTNELLSRGCKVVALDNYEGSKKIALENKNFGKNLFFFKSNFKDIDLIIYKNKIKKKFDGVLLDLGFSSNQLEDPDLGISFKKNIPLNMNYADYTITASDILNNYNENQLTEMFYNYGEIYDANKLSKYIILSRKNKKIKTTFDFIEILKNSGVNFASKKINFATKPFQAVRIEANKELENLKIFLDKINDFLEKNALIFIISFHSLEDRIVKNYFKLNSLKRDQSFKNNNNWGYEVITKRPLIASNEELLENPRARSAKLRVAKFTC